MRRVVITGCSGGGKSTLLDEFERRGQAVVREPGRRVIAAERETGGQGFPWEDHQRFASLAFWMSVGDHGAADSDPTFFDRSALDQAAWFLREGLPLPDALPDYFRMVFVAPPWPEIYQVDADRKHGFDEAITEFDDLMKRLPEWGYDCRVLPKTGVSDRADWVMAELDEAAS